MNLNSSIIGAASFPADPSDGSIWGRGALAFLPLMNINSISIVKT
nr:MAG TPA: hypothetical protein [Caudoviricetes sp.]